MTNMEVVSGHIEACVKTKLKYCKQCWRYDQKTYQPNNLAHGVGPN